MLEAGRRQRLVISLRRSVEARVGDGIDVDQLDKEMGADFLAALVGAGANPKISIQVK
jgi:hypothetical protein